MDDLSSQVKYRDGGRQIQTQNDQIDSFFDDSSDNLNFLDRSENPFWLAEQANEEGFPRPRTSGNGKTLLHKMTHGDIREEILNDVKNRVDDIIPLNLASQPSPTDEL